MDTVKPLKKRTQFYNLPWNTNTILQAVKQCGECNVSLSRNGEIIQTKSFVDSGITFSRGKCRLARKTINVLSKRGITAIVYPEQHTILSFYLDDNTQLVLSFNKSINFNRG